MVPLGEVMRKSSDWIELDPTQKYKEITVRLWGKGVVERREVFGSEIAAGERLRVRADQLILSKIDARNGAIGLVPQNLNSAVASADFPTFDIDQARLSPKYLDWLSKTADFAALCKSASEGTTNRVRLKEDRFLALPIPLPPLAEQQRIVARIEALAAKIEEVVETKQSVERDLDSLLLSEYHQIADAAPRRPMVEVAPILRRPVNVEADNSYPQVSTRSFGRGTFHKPPLQGNEITWQKPFLVREGDILISNIKAWEGAIAVASEEDDGRFASHRYLTCVPNAGIATAGFVCFHLLTSQGLMDIGEASPGSADRNRTLNMDALQQISIPSPSYESQLRFDNLQAKVDALKQLQAESAAELEVLLPSVLDKAFKGEL
jgi:type I restriction enzyme S subunit